MWSIWAGMRCLCPIRRYHWYSHCDQQQPLYTIQTFFITHDTSNCTHQSMSLLSKTKTSNHYSHCYWGYLPPCPVYHDQQFAIDTTSLDLVWMVGLKYLDQSKMMTKNLSTIDSLQQGTIWTRGFWSRVLSRVFSTLTQNFPMSSDEPWRVADSRGMQRLTHGGHSSCVRLIQTADCKTNTA